MHKYNIMTLDKVKNLNFKFTFFIMSNEIIINTLNRNKLKHDLAFNLNDFL